MFYVRIMIEYLLGSNLFENIKNRLDPRKLRMYITDKYTMIRKNCLVGQYIHLV